MNKKADTLLILSPAFAAYEGDEVLPAQENLVRAINKTHPLLNVIILAFHFPVVQQKEYNWYGNTIIPFSGAMKGKTNSIFLWAQVWRTLKRLKKQNNIIGLFSFFCSESAFVGHYFARLYKLKHFIWVLGQDAKKENKQVKRIHPKEEELIVISDFLQREFEQSHGIKPKHIIPIGINPTLFSTDRIERDIDILGAGSFIPLKQYNVFIEVFKTLTERMPNLTAQLLGNGIEEHRLKELVKQFNLVGKLSFEGKKTNSEVLHLMQRTKIFLHTSSYEGFGAVALEALYAGAQVISFCQPMNKQIEHWHIVQTKEEMIEKAFQILQSKHIDCTPILPYEIHEIARKIIALY
jgi:glycosyltransferase involved in cell wall biosynthesis